MANIASARKRARQSEKRRLHNASLKSRMRTAVKNVLKAIRNGDKSEAESAFRLAEPVLNSSVNKRLIHRNKADRHKRRLNVKIKAMNSS